MSEIEKPLKAGDKHTLAQVRQKIRKFYGVKDPDAWYLSMRKSINDRCLKDEFGITRFSTLEEYWAAKQEAVKWGRWSYEEREPNESV